MWRVTIETVLRGCALFTAPRERRTPAALFLARTFRLTVSITSNESCELSNEKSTAAETLTQ